MRLDAPLSSNTPAARYHGYFRILILLSLVQFGVMAAGVYVGLMQVERVVSAIERAEVRFNQAADEATSLGQSAVTKSQAVIDRLDAVIYSVGSAERLPDLDPATPQRVREVLKSTNPPPSETRP